MKKSIFLFILLLIFALTLTVGGCETENEVKSVNSKEIEIQGTVNGKTVINPAFDWVEEGDLSFTVTIKDAAGTEVESAEVNVPHYQPKESLEYGKEYVISVVGKDTGTCYRANFETMAGENEPNLQRASISLCDPFKSHMVIQRGKPIVIKGSTAANVLLCMDFYGTRYYAVSDQTGAFTFTLPAMQANATPAEITISLLQDKSLVLSDVLIGDVYLASGQSNMWWKLRDSDYTQTDVDNAVNSDMRYFSMSITTSSTPRESVKNGKWAKISRSDNSYLDYSAVAFMTASMLSTALAPKGVPIGIVCAAQGDTNIANWMSSEYYSGSVGTKNLNYNAMIYPLHNGEFTGVIWYQGCNNSAKGNEYKQLLQGLMANWRELFHNDTLPFYIVQLPVYDGDSGNNYDFSFVRESQALACAADENAYLIATCDGGNPSYIHPTEKRYIAERLQKSVLSTVYGEDYLPQGPTYRSHVVEGSRVTITVDNGEGLCVPQGENVVGFLLAGADGKYYDATATIEDGKLVVTSPSVAAPVYIKYGFGKSPFLNVYNKDGFLMSPFRTDLYNHGIDLLDYTSAAPASYKIHPDGSQMTCRIVSVNGETGTEIQKADDGKNFGSVQLEKWGAIGFNELGMKLTVIGTNSGAKVLFRIVEGSYEIWAYEFEDNFSGRKEFVAALSEFECVSNRVDGIMDLQAVRQVEVTVKADGAATVTIIGVQFTDIARSAPLAFTINEGSEERENYIITYTPATFANEYRVIVSADGVNYTDPIVDEVTSDTRFTFPTSLRASGTLYYVKVIARNELGETVAKNSGITLRDNERYVINHFDYASEEQFDDYVSSHMKVHEGLTVSLDEKGVKILSAGKGWQYFIFVLESGFNKGYDTLKFYMDVRDYHGSRIVLQLVDSNYVTFSYTMNNYSKKEGFFEIPLSAFTRKDDGTKFDGRDVFRIQFNFEDITGDGTVYFDDLELLKS